MSFDPMADAAGRAIARYSFAPFQSANSAIGLDFRRDVAFPLG